MRKKNRSSKDHPARYRTGGVKAICPANRFLYHCYPKFSMKIISWNVIGLSGTLKDRMLKRKILQYIPFILFMQETKCSFSSSQSLLPKIWKGCQVIASDANGASGGITVAWNPNILYLDNFTSSHHSLSASFHILGIDLMGHIMNLYGPQTPSLKIILLDHIS